MFNPILIDNKEQIRDGLKQPYLVLKDALMQDKAEQLYTDLNNAERWERQSVTQQNFTYQRRQIKIGADMEVHNVPESLLELYRFLSSEVCLQWVYEISGRKCVDFMGAAALYGIGDSISLHNDFMPHDCASGDKLIRAVAFNLYLTKEWHPDWGGKFVWDTPRAEIIPEFNKLVMFLVGPNSLHLVEPVISDAPRKRLAVTGWFMRNREVSRPKLKLS